MGKLYSTTEVAEMLGIHPTQARVLCQQGRLQGAQKVGRDWVIPEGAIREYKPRGPGRPKAPKLKDILREAGVLPPPED